MGMKKLIVGLVLTVFAVASLASPALAGAKQRHRWEGVAIGVGAAILGHAIFQAHQAQRSPQVVYVPPEPGPHPQAGARHRYGHWEWQETWVPPAYEKLWNPGHYNRKGRWVPGHWMEVKTSPGHWEKGRVWVAGR